jgi:hypothetical protein
MKLNYNSFSSKLYRWIYYSDTNEMPNNLCPYFWRLVVAYIIALPVLVLTLPYELIRLFKKDKEEMDMPLLPRIISTVVFAIALFVIAALLAPISLFFGYSPIESSGFNSMINGGIFLWFIGGIVGLVYGITYLVDKYKNRSKVIKEAKSENIVVEFVKAKYNKYCPKIEWVNKHNKNEDYE